MRLLRFLFLLLPLLAWAQNSQSQNSQSSTPQAAPAQQPSPPPAANFGVSPAEQPLAAQPQATPQVRRFRIITRPPQQKRLQPLPDGPLDPGIFMRKQAGANHVCGAIVSYNFSPGDNPRLQSVTTCTPAGIVTRRWTGGSSNEPATKQLLQANN